MLDSLDIRANSGWGLCASQRVGSITETYSLSVLTTVYGELIARDEVWKVRP